MISRPDRQADSRRPRPEARTAPPRPLDITALVARLTERDRWILRMLHEHRVLTTKQLGPLAFPTPAIALRRLRLLHSYGVLERFRPLRARGSAPVHWVLAPAGAAVLAAEAGISVRELGYNHQRALAVAHSLHLAHTVGVAEWFTALIAHAPRDQQGNQAQVQAWWSQTRCQRLWGDLARPDAFGRYAHPETTLDFFLEYDLASTTLTRVAAKLHGYGELARTTGVITPVLLWVPTAQREANARAALRRTWERLPDPEAVPVATAAAELLPENPEASPAEQVWLPLDTDSDADRRCLHELSARWPRRTSPTSIDSEQPVPSLNGIVVLAPPPPQPPASEFW
ncbi:replication-relaxation family protein [Nocardia fluminea]|uniref:Protein involved in plasmid replication-relaxation n=1 Tax=Nocardia fluminea TaxID=134984 RepID=A0A2N3WYH0_9NOCA|nr:replication-relaxation family protein [Nocardia fluminea]PKV98923.1 protein involved in plasmid replication-relaxation [Nocardia fluminea]